MIATAGPLTLPDTLQSSGPAATPTGKPTRKVLPLETFNAILYNGTDTASNLTERSLFDPEHLVERGLFDREEEKEKVLRKRRLQIRATCVDSSANDVYITSMFYYGGAGTVVYLCPYATITTTNAIFFSASNQILTTYGNPQDASRAIIRVAGSSQSVAVYGAIDGANQIMLRNVIVDGSRQTLGLITGGSALLEFGGSNYGQQVVQVKAYEPRGWSVLHAAEGSGNSCTSIAILNNDIGPSGHAPSGATQFRKRDSTGYYPPGQWADGISLACKNSQVYQNLITDATDGGIVIFGAPGSLISENRIVSSDRQLLGGINMVDYSPFAGSFVGTVVQDNNIVAQGSMIKVGIAMGGMIWGVDNRTSSRTYGGLVQNNHFTSGTTGYFGFGIATSGHNAATIKGNVFTKSNYGGVDSTACFTAYYPLPAPEALVGDPYTCTGNSFQTPTDLRQTIVLAICRGPGPITGTIS
ncbi:hypothetical protein JCM8547_007587 [Rhodosporidiobolus lusitaniae]